MSWRRAWKPFQPHLPALLPLPGPQGSRCRGWGEVFGRQRATGRTSGVENQAGGASRGGSEPRAALVWGRFIPGELQGNFQPWETWETWERELWERELWEKELCRWMTAVFVPPDRRFRAVQRFPAGQAPADLLRQPPVRVPRDHQRPPLQGPRGWLCLLPGCGNRSGGFPTGFWDNGTPVGWVGVLGSCPTPCPFPVAAAILGALMRLWWGGDQDSLVLLSPPGSSVPFPGGQLVPGRPPLHPGPRHDALRWPRLQDSGQADHERGLPGAHEALR